MKLKMIALAVACAALVCAAPAQAQKGRALVRLQLDSAATLMANENFEAAHENVFGNLAQGQDEEFEMRVSAGESYIFVGVCDENCSDLDIHVYDADGEEIDSDVELDDTPMVAVEPKRNMTVRVKVTMATCSSDCHFGMGVYTN
jgi:hypothetical protein